MTVKRVNADQAQERLQGRGPAFQTVTGQLIYYLDPTPDVINIYDLAIGLSNQCRFNGQLPVFYSVAQHSVIVAELAEAAGKNPRACLKALLHDAHEAYLGDIVTPLKIILEQYKEIEHKIDDAICKKYHIVKGMPLWLHHLDKIVLSTEIRDLRPEGAVDHTSKEHLLPPSDKIKITPLDPTSAALLFMKKYLQYTGQ